MGEACKDALWVDLDRSAKLEFYDSTISSDSGPPFSTRTQTVVPICSQKRSEFGFRRWDVILLLERPGDGVGLRSNGTASTVPIVRD